MECPQELFKTPEQLISKAPLNQLRKRRTKLFANALLLKAQVNCSIP